MGFGRGGALAGVLLVVLVMGGLSWSAATGRPASAARPRLFAGSLVLEDSRPLTVINVATAQVTVRLEGVNAEVGAVADGDVQPVPVDGGTMLVNRLTGAFNFLDADDYVTDPHGPGVGLGRLDRSTGALGLASGADAYILRDAPDSTVSLVGKQTVAQAARAQSGTTSTRPSSVAASVPPLGFSQLGGQVSLQPGSAAVSDGDLWVLVSAAAGCRVVELRPQETSRQGLVAAGRGATSSCARAALEVAGGSVGVALPGQVRVFPAAGPPVAVAVPFTHDATDFLPVTGATNRLWYLARTPAGWELFGVTAHGRTAGPFPLAGLGASADPVAPVLSAGFLYTLDQTAAGAPTLWTIDLAGGRMAPLSGVARYPVANASERPAFRGAQVLVDGPRVVFNNPESLEAVVVFTDGTHPPVVVDKSQAVAVSTTGPADLNPQTSTTVPGSKGHNGAPGSSSPQKVPVPVVQPVNRQVTCAQTTQKPYAPQITGITPSSEAAVIQWSYELLDQTDCEPDTWTVQIRALTGGHQPAAPLQVVSGQDQYLFKGLRPATTYQAVVTAFINRQSTPSTPATFTTPARGPDAPLSVHTTADGKGGWVVSWTPCTEATHPDCVVPAAQWTVTGQACNGSFVGSPPNVQVPGGQDSVTIDGATQNLLGDFLSFTVQGSLASGLAGNPTGDGACTEAYQPPDGSAITVKGAGAEDAATGTITATLTVETTGDPATVFGVPAGEAQFVYTVSGPAGARTVGPTNQTSVVVPGLAAGTSYTPSVLIYPDGHPDANATVNGAPFSQTLAWPDLSQPKVTTAVDQHTYGTGTVTLTFPATTPSGPVSAVAPSSANSPGSGPQVQCGGPGGAVQSYPVQALTPAHQLTLTMSDLVDYGGSCSVSLSLTDGATPDPYGGPSPTIRADFQIGSQPSYDFTFTYVGCGKFQCGPLGKPYTIEVDTTSAFGGGGDWSVTTQDPALPQKTDPCYADVGSSSMPNSFDIELPSRCVATDQLKVGVNWKYLGQQESAPADPTNTPGSPATTTTTSTTTTTVPPCNTTTSAPSGNSTTSTSSCTTTTTSSGASGGTAAGLAAGTTVPAVAVAAAWGLGAGRRKRSKERR